MLVVATGLGMNPGLAAAKTTGPTFLEVCTTGNVSNPTAYGFPFSINGGPTIYVPVHECSGDETVSVGDNRVTELPDPSGATMLQSVTVFPKSAKVHRKITNTKKQAGWAEVDITSGSGVAVTFTNEPASGELKVCKDVAAGSPMIGDYFSFTEQAGGQTVGPFSLEAEVAGSTNPNQCGRLTTYPVGTNVTVTEAALSGTNDVLIGGVTVNGDPISFNANPPASGGGGSAVASVGATGETIVDVTNVLPVGPPADLEICVQAGDQYVPAAPPGSPNGWELTISGNGITPVNEWVLAGQCSGDFTLPVGDYTVTEDDLPYPYSVSSITGDPTAAQDVDLTTASAEFPVAANSTESAVFTIDS